MLHLLAQRGRSEHKAGFKSNILTSEQKMGWAGVICAQWAQITPVKVGAVSILHRQKEPHQPSKHKELLEHKSHSVLHLLALNLLAEEGRIRIHLQRLIFSLPSHFGSEAPLYSTKSGQIWQTQALFIVTLSSSSLFSSLCSSCRRVFKTR